DGPVEVELVRDPIAEEPTQAAQGERHLPHVERHVRAEVPESAPLGVADRGARPLLAVLAAALVGFARLGGALPFGSFALAGPGLAALAHALLEELEELFIGELVELLEVLGAEEALERLPGEGPEELRLELGRRVRAAEVVVEGEVEAVEERLALH